MALFSTSQVVIGAALSKLKFDLDLKRAVFGLWVATASSEVVMAYFDQKVFSSLLGSGVYRATYATKRKEPVASKYEHTASLPESRQSTPNSDCLTSRS